MYRFATCLLATAALATGSLAHAQDATPSPEPADTPAKAAAHAVVRPGDPGCLRSTGSLIPPRPGKCLPVAGRSYSREDIRRTGAVDTADALRMLDPSVTMQGH